MSSCINIELASKLFCLQRKDCENVYNVPALVRGALKKTIKKVKRMVRKYNQAKNRLTIYAAIRHSSCLILSSCLLNTCSVIPFIPQVSERDLRMVTIWRKKKLLVNYFLYNLIYM